MRSGVSPSIRQIIGRYFGLTSALHGNALQSRAPDAERRTMLETPGSLEIVGIIGRLAFIEIDDPLDGEFFAIRLDEHGMRREDRTHPA